MQDKPLVMILVKRVSIFMCVICVITIIYWGIGSVAPFLDETQIMLLGMMRLSSLGLVAFAILGGAIAVGCAVLRRYRLRVGGLAAYLAVSVLGVAVLFVAQSVIALSKGLR